MDDKLHLNARIFHDRLNNLIQTEIFAVGTDTFDGEAGKHINIASTDVTGVEIEFDIRPDSSLRFFGNVAFLKIEGNNQPRDLISIEFENSAPERSASLLAIKQFNEHYSGSLGIYYADEMLWLDVPNRQPSSYTTMDLRLSKSIRRSDSTSKISLVLKNLLDEYNDYHTMPNRGPLIEHNLTGYIEYSILFQ